MSAPIPLPIKLKNSHLRPIAYRILSKKHGLHVKSDALEVLTDYIGTTFGSQWKSPQSLKFIEEIGKKWKSTFQGNKNLFIDGENLKLVIASLTQPAKKSAAPQVQSTLNGLLETSENDLTRSKTVVDLVQDTVNHNSANQDVTSSTGNTSQTSDLSDTSMSDYDSTEAFAIWSLDQLPIFEYNHSRKKYEPYLPPQSSDATNDSQISKRFAHDFHPSDNLKINVSRYYQIYHRLLRNESFHYSSAVNPTSSTYFDELELLDSAEQLTKFQSLNEEIHQLTLVMNLLGRHGSQVLVFGMISKNQEGKYQIQDPTGCIELNLENAFPDENYMYFDGCFVICDGIYTNFGAKEKLVVNLIYQPQPEEKSGFIKHFGNIDFKNANLNLKSVKSKNRGFEETEKIILLGSDIYLDSLKTLDYLKKVFESFDAQVPPLAIVFPGSFIKKPFEVSPMDSLGDNSSMKYKGLFDSLAIVVERFPSICLRTQFVFVAGRQDPWASLVYQGSKSGCLPYPKLASIFFNRLARVVKNLKIVTNPFQMSYLDRDIMVLNDDVYERMSYNNIDFNYYQEKDVLIRSALETVEQPTIDTHDHERDRDNEDENNVYSIPSMANLHISELSKNSLRMTEAKARRRAVSKLVKTLVSQAHLSPFSLNIRPVTWKYECLLSMNPLPETLILFDKSLGFFNEDCSGSQIINVGKFMSLDNKSASYVEYCPGLQTVELREVFGL